MDESDSEHSRCAHIISTSDNGNKFIEIEKRNAGRNFIDALGKKYEEVTINDGGWGNFLAPAGSLSVWIEKM